MWSTPHLMGFLQQLAVQSNVKTVHLIAHSMGNRALTQALANLVTLYASSHDKALKASKKLHEFPRAGEAGQSLLIVKGIDTIDVSAVDSSLLGHSYFGDNTSVISDLHRLLTQGSPPNQRACLSEATLLNLAYWVFVRDACMVH